MSTYFIVILLIAVPAIAAGVDPPLESSGMMEPRNLSCLEVELMTTSSPRRPYDCSITTFRQARAAVSFEKGLDLIQDLHDRSLRHLIEQTQCPDETLSLLNMQTTKIFSTMDYRTTLATNHSNDMQALYDILQGIAKER